MTEYTNQYQAKLVTPEKAVHTIKNNSTLVVAMAAGAPPAILKAISQRVKMMIYKACKFGLRLPPGILVKPYWPMI